MGKIQFFSNLCLRRNPKSLPLLASQIRNQSLGSVQLNKVSEESTQHRQNLDSVSESSSSSQELMKTLQNEPARIREVVREVSKFFRTQARWEQELLHEFPGVNFADPVIYNAVLRRENNAFLSLRFYQWLRFRVVAVLNYMIAKNVPPDIDVYHEIIKTLCNSRMIDEGFRIFNELKDRGYFPDRAMYTTMIWGLCTYKDVGDARKLWCEMIQNKMVPDECAYNVFIDGLFNSGCVDEAEKLYEEMLAEGIRETTKTYNTMINGLGLNSKVEEARALFETMHEKGIRRDSSTYNSLIKGFLRQGNLTEGTYFLNELLKHGFQPTNSSFTMLIEKLCEAGHVKEAATLWLEMRNRGLEGEGDHLLEPIVEGLTKQGCVEEAIERLGYMISVGLRPKNAILEGLVRADKFGDGSFLFLGYMVKMGVCSLNRLSVIVRSKKLRIEKVERRGGVFS